ncbi:MAG TPA: ABC transporter ATP-binding protein [Euzebyales bacterium]|nr:ABC transporter ATP-binding protein [Euzebyales bacterium]
MLTLDDISAGYAGLEVLHGLSLQVDAGEVVALIGANGAGKTTTLRTIMGIVRPRRGAVTLDGDDVTGTPAHRMVRRGVAMVAEDRELFGALTVRENLLMGAFTRDRSEAAASLDEVHALFPVLAERAPQRAETLSGGQQQMLAIARALMARPRLLLLDEPSLGLAPQLVQAVFDIVTAIRERGITVLIVEQNAARTLQLADRAYVLESGEIAVQGSGRELLDDQRVRAAYLGV